MNPLSSHPPRTPRTSIIASTHVYGASIYETKEEVQADDDAEDDDNEEETDKMKEAESRVRHEEVWREMFLSSNGRDKAFVRSNLYPRFVRLIPTPDIEIDTILYQNLPVISYLTDRQSTSAPASASTMGIGSRQTTPIYNVRTFLHKVDRSRNLLHVLLTLQPSHRKTLLLFNWLSPLTAVMAQQTVPYSAEQSTEATKKTTRPFLHTVLYAPPPVLLELVHAAADDVYTFSLLGLIGKRTGERAARFSDWCWLLATLVGLVENGVERQMIGGLQHEGTRISLMILFCTTPYMSDAIVESRLYKESMSGATAKSKPTTSKIDEKELSRLQKQDYWLQITRAKLVMDLIFVCKSLICCVRLRPVDVPLIAYDLFRIKRGKESAKAFTGFAAAILRYASVILFTLPLR